jgi:hypothetical protein
MASSVKIEITPNFDRWIEGMAVAPVTIAAVARIEWKAAADVMFDRTQQYVHVITGRLKASGKPAQIKTSHDEVTATIEYDAPYAIYEEARGGAHAFMTRGYEASSRMFESAMPKAWERLVMTWR